MEIYSENPEREQDRLPVTFSLLANTGQAIFPENKKIYENLSKILKGRDILEVGCGIGLGSALLERNNTIVATDKLRTNIKIASALYPWVNFKTSDISQTPLEGFEVTVCIETIEHIKNYRQAIHNLVNSANEIWIATPNRSNLGHGLNKPYNDFHVKEFTIGEMLEMIGEYKVELYNWNTFEKVSKESRVTPMVYQVLK